MDLPVMAAVFMDEFSQLHVVATIFRDVQKATVFEPADCLQSFRRFFHAECRRRN